ncbi:MAG: aldo/keto reductase [Deltaproteobacteria bacterium SG8_13]|nr:MAG: aldo/keto reductase [Deltaproteobacteria bacterium SG8_13]
MPFYPLINRRHFLKVAGAATMGSILSPLHPVEAAVKPTPVPTRPFGRTGIDVSILSFGGSLHLPQLMLRQAFKWGVTYWDTANSYMGGNSEQRIGKYLAAFPQDRKKIFLVTKSHAWSTEGMSADLDESLLRMNTDYVDLFFVHGISGIDEMDDDKRRWGEKKKAEGKVRLFGFSTHSNMEQCLLSAAGLGWIDAIMMTYNYRLMDTDEMRRAVDACAEAGIGLTAMKTQGGGSFRWAGDRAREITDRFVAKGFTEGQAKLKAVWENRQIASICSEMPNMKLLMENVSAALDRTRLSARDRQVLQRHARLTRSGYCAGCARICESAVTAEVPIRDAMRYLMYGRSYGDRHRAAHHFQQIPEHTRQTMAVLDYSHAEQACPQQMAIGRLIREGLIEFT